MKTDREPFDLSVEKISRAGDKVFKRANKIIAEAVDEVLNTDIRKTVIEELRHILQLAATRELMMETSDHLEKRVKKLGRTVFDKETYIQTLDEEIASRKKELAKLEKRILTLEVVKRMKGR